MPEYLRTLIVILLFSTTFFAFAGRPVSAIIGRDVFTRRRNIWFGLTLAAFLAHNFWLYTIIAILLLFYANRHESNPPALFFFILFVLPIASIEIPGIGSINVIFELSHAKILEFFILLPAFFVLLRQSHNLSFLRSSPDKAMVAYLLFTAVLLLRNHTFTDSLRGCLYLFIDVFLPYFVISRSLINLQSFRDALLSLVLAIMVVASMAPFESFRHWLLYASLLDLLKLQQGSTDYTGRDNMLRAVVTAGQSISLGYLMVVGMGIYLYLQHFIQNKFIRQLGMLLLVAGLIAALSRGPWVGAAVLLVMFFATGRHAVRRLTSLAMVAILTLTLVSMLPGGERIINLLPFIGSTEKENVDYREQLITNSIITIERNLWFGSFDYKKTPEMQAMIQGQGIIDIVNTYIGIALESGLVGLGLFVSFFATIIMGIIRAMRSIPNKDSEYYLLGRALLATLVAILVIIFTVSSITIIPIVYWSFAGVGMAYVQMVRNGLENSSHLNRAISFL